MLKTEQNTEKMQQRVLKAARKAFKGYSIYGDITAHFEHGQWWIQFDDDAEDRIRSYSVQDAEGNADWIIDGFSFEEC